MSNNLNEQTFEQMLEAVFSLDAKPEYAYFGPNQHEEVFAAGLAPFCPLGPLE